MSTSYFWHTPKIFILFQVYCIEFAHRNDGEGKFWLPTHDVAAYHNLNFFWKKRIKFILFSNEESREILNKKAGMHSYDFINL